MIHLVVAFVLFIFMLVLLCFCVATLFATVSRRIKIYIVAHLNLANGQTDREGTLAPPGEND